MGPRLMAGKKVRAPTMMTVPTRRRVKVTPETGKLPALTGMVFLAARRPGQGQHRHDEQEAADEGGQPQGQVIPGGIGRQTGKGAAVVADTGSKGIEYFAEAVGAGIIQGREAPLGWARPGR